MLALLPLLTIRWKHPKGTAAIRSEWRWNTIMNKEMFRQDSWDANPQSWQVPVFARTRFLAPFSLKRTMDRHVWMANISCWLSLGRKKRLPFLKVDKGLAPRRKRSQLMKPIPIWISFLGNEPKKDISSVQRCLEISLQPILKESKRVVASIFEIAQGDCGGWLVPIIEPEVTSYPR